MGWKKKKRGVNKNTRQEGNTTQRAERKNYEEAERKNDNFEKYYKVNFFDICKLRVVI